MDQSYSVDNFVRIYFNENRKGNFIERIYFPDLKVYSNAIVKLNRSIRLLKNMRRHEKITDIYFKKSLRKKRDIKKQFQEKKVNQLKSDLLSVATAISEKKMNIKLSNTFSIAGKPVYTIKQTVEIFFLLKQLQNNLNRCFKINMADRYEIVSQLINVLNNKFPKYVIKTDIVSFYENIPHDGLKNLIQKNPALDSFSKEIIWKILKGYESLSGEKKGVPRGIGVSAYLSELYMRDIDERIRNIKNLTFYARYVDDIVAVFTPNVIDCTEDFSKIVAKEIEDVGKLELNPRKTDIFDLRNSEVEKKIEFLGYDIAFHGGHRVGLTKKKLEKYKNKIDKIFQYYNYTSKHDEKMARKVFIKSMKYVTQNTRLLNVKKNILVGIYFSNSLLTDTKDLRELDKYYQEAINIKISPYQKLNCNIEKFKNRLRSLSFEDGFLKRKFSKFATSELVIIKKILNS